MQTTTAHFFRSMKYKLDYEAEQTTSRKPAGLFDIPQIALNLPERWNF
jgi:hypothetical protein